MKNQRILLAVILILLLAAAAISFVPMETAAHSCGTKTAEQACKGECEDCCQKTGGPCCGEEKSEEECAQCGCCKGKEACKNCCQKTDGPCCGEEKSEKECAQCGCCKGNCLVILHTNDFHGQITPSRGKDEGGSAYLASAIIKEKAAAQGRTLLLDAGDFAQGTPISNEFHGKPVLEIMNLLKYDAMTIGNHEFDWRQPAMKDMIKWAEFPAVCANIVYEEDESKLFEGLKPYIIKEAAGTKVGIIGLTTTRTPYVTKMENVKGLKILDPSETAKKYIPRMKSEGAEVILALTHMGLDDDKKLAKDVPEINIIIGGHSHSTLKEPVKVGDTIIAQAGSRGRFLGRLVVCYNKETQKIHNCTPSEALIHISHENFEPNSEVAAIITRYEEEIGPKFKVEVGSTEKDLTRRTGKDHSDSVLGNLITDAMRKESGAHLAVYNSGGIRADIPAGKIVVEDMINVLPFDNWLVTVNMTGEGVKTILEHGARGSGSAQVSGATFTIDYSKPAGERIENLIIAGEPIDMEKEYTVTTIDFLFTGGDEYPFEKLSANVKYGDHIRDVVSQYVKENSPLSLEADGRIKAVSKEVKDSDY